MPRDRQSVLAEAGIAFQRLYRAERDTALRPDEPAPIAALGTVLDVILAQAVTVPAVRRARQRQARIGTTPVRR